MVIPLVPKKQTSFPHLYILLRRKDLKLVCKAQIAKSFYINIYPYFTILRLFVLLKKNKRKSGVHVFRDSTLKIIIFLLSRSLVFLIYLPLQAICQKPFYLDFEAYQISYPCGWSLSRLCPVSRRQGFCSHSG